LHSIESDLFVFVCFAARKNEETKAHSKNIMMNSTYSQSRLNQGFGMEQRRKEINPEALLEGLPEIGGVLDPLKVGMERLNELSETEIAILLRLNNDKLKADFLTKKFALKPSSPIPDESTTCELKSGLKAIPNTYWDMLPHHGGIKLIFTELCAMYNSTGNGTVYIGVSDSKRPTALENQIACLWPNMNRDRFISTVLFNIARTWTQSDYFLNSLTFDWFTLEHHLILKIGVQRTMKHDITLCNPKCWMLPYRINTSLKYAKAGYDMIKMYNQLTNQLTKN
jgi:hypothetical protein